MDLKSLRFQKRLHNIGADLQHRHWTRFSALAFKSNVTNYHGLIPPWPPVPKPETLAGKHKIHHTKWLVWDPQWPFYISAECLQQFFDSIQTKLASACHAIAFLCVRVLPLKWNPSCRTDRHLKIVPKCPLWWEIGGVKQPDISMKKLNWQYN